MATGRNHPQLEQLCASLGERRPERIRDPDHAGASAVVTVRNRSAQCLGLRRGLAVETSAEREQRHYAIAAQGLSRLTQIRLLVLIAAVLALVAAIGAMIWQRRDLSQH